MGLKESGLRGSLRNVSVGIDAIPDSVVTRPDSNDLDHFSGDTDDVTIQTDVSFGENDETYEFAADDSVVIFSDNGLDAYPSRGQQLSCLLQGSDDGSNSILHYGFGAQSIDNYYAVGIFVNNEIRIRKDGSTVATQSATIDPDTTYLLVTDWTDSDPEIVVELYNENDDPDEDSPLESVTYSDDEYDSGGIVFEYTRDSGGTSPPAYAADYWIRKQL